MWNYKCPNCGANLDPGEACDCEKEATRRPERREDHGFWNRDHFDHMRNNPCHNHSRQV